MFRLKKRSRLTDELAYTKPIAKAHQTVRWPNVAIMERPFKKTKAMVPQKLGRKRVEGLSCLKQGHRSPLINVLQGYHHRLDANNATWPKQCKTDG